MKTNFSEKSLKDDTVQCNGEPSWDPDSEYCSGYRMSYLSICGLDGLMTSSEWLYLVNTTKVYAGIVSFGVGFREEHKICKPL